VGLNIYTTEFFARCPNNGIRVKYALRIEATGTIPVEEIIDCVEKIHEGFHEAIADELFATFRGKQTLTADHHGVTIETTRGGPSRNDYLDQSVGGMAGTPGY
jgi:hypothetical protein